MPQSKEPFRDPSEPLFEQRINELEKGEGIGQVTTAKLAANAVTGEKTAAAVLSPRKLIYTTSLLVLEKLATKLYLPIGSGLAPLASSEATKGVFELTEAGKQGIPLLNLKPSQYEIAGRTLKLITEIYVFANTVAPGVSLTAGLAEVTLLEGAEKTLKVTVAAQTAGTTAAIAAAGAKEATAAEATNTFPAASNYVLTLLVGGTETAAKSMQAVSMSLYASYS